MILSNYFKDEIKLNEVQIAEMLDVSPTPVREAFRMLSSDGLVEIIPWKGVFIKKYTIEDLTELYQCREALEVLAVQLSIQKIDIKEIQSLKTKITSHSESVDERVKLSNTIHEIILKWANNKRLTEMLSQLNSQLVYDRRMTAYDEERQKEIDSEHMEILNALMEKNEEKAVTSMQNHIRNGLNYIKNNYTH
ncbi:MAG: GntR family transcriptional regulator [Tissierellia bacterium]|nr:GntR family transcriptional regulator [Tissierellia bacterium]